jgi:hypothetical protein
LRTVLVSFIFFFLEFHRVKIEKMSRNGWVLEVRH